MNEDCATPHHERTQAWARMHPRRSLYRFTVLPRRPLVPSAANTAAGNGNCTRDGSHRRLQGHRLSGDHLWRVHRPAATAARLSATPPRVCSPRPLYDNKVRDLVLDRILKDGMSVEQTLKSLRREFFLDLSTGFVYDVLHDHAEATRHVRLIAARSWSISAARSASTNCTWAASRCCWPPTR